MKITDQSNKKQKQEKFSKHRCGEESMSNIKRRSEKQIQKNKIKLI